MSAERWALVEMMGHRLEGGLVSERSFAGVPFVQIRRPKTALRDHTVECMIDWSEAPTFPQVCECPQELEDKLIGAAAVYCLTFCDEATVRARLFPAPWRPASYELETAYGSTDEVLEDAVLDSLPSSSSDFLTSEESAALMGKSPTEILTALKNRRDNVAVDAARCHFCPELPAAFRVNTTDGVVDQLLCRDCYEEDATHGRLECSTPLDSADAEVF